MVYHTPTNRPRIVEVVEVREEVAGIHTIILKDEPCSKARPGQFAMVWVPGAGESPMSISYMGEDELCGIRVKPTGPTSTTLCKSKPSDLVGIRGPYGNGFKPVSGSCLLVGGGVGLAPLIPLSKILMEKGSTVTLIIAGKSRNELLLLREAEALLSGPKRGVLVSTDDGSHGFKGVASEYVAEILKTRSFDMIYACGPEAMLNQIFNLAEQHGIPLQASLERHMKCGVGLCGSCAIGRYLVCVDGPIFDSEQLREVSQEFGFTKRDACGRIVPI